jgi:TolB protein
MLGESVKKLCLILVGCVLAGRVLAQPTVISRTGDGAVAIDLSGFSTRSTAEQAFYRSLRTNLTLSSLMQEVPPSQARYRVSGGVSPAGSAVEVTLRVLDATNRARYAKRFRTPSDQMEQVARKIADDITEELTGRPGFASHRIACIGVSPNQRGKEIFAVYPDGGGRLQLTRDQSVKLGLEWTPDGEGLIYTSYHRGFPDIYQHDIQKGQRKTLSSSAGINAGGTLSPDGRYLAMVLSKDAKPELYVKDLGSGRLTRLTDTRMAPKSSPSWSPDGRSIVFTSSHQGAPHLYVISRSGGAPRRLTRGGGENLSADWGDNGWIAYTTRRGGKYQIALLDPATGESRIISPPNADFEDPSWAPDGVHVVASRTIRGQSNLYVLDSAGKEAKSLNLGPGSYYMPSWAP